MLEISFLFIIFISSILLVSMLLRVKLPISNTNGKSLRWNAELVMKSAPFMAWVEHKKQVKWSNKAVKRTNRQVEALGNAAFTFTDSTQGFSLPRLGLLPQKGSEPRNFNIFTHKINDMDFYFAFANDGAGKSKKPQSQFIQTLSATFAHLQVGIAVFDNKNELSLFNPALSQHLGLRPEWLLKKPNLLSFLDRLRDTNILPEPKSYTSWRKTFHKIERSAMKDDYREDWELPDGRALRVIGRPHPSGTVVFLFEDVTTTLAMERNYRTEVSVYKNTLETATVGFVVFDRNGNSVYSNKRLKQTLGKQCEHTTIQDFSLAMQKAFRPTPAWGDFRQFVLDTSERTRWQADVQTVSGDHVSVNFIPIISGNTLCEFHFPQKINTAINVSLTCAAQ